MIWRRGEPGPGGEWYVDSDCGQFRVAKVMVPVEGVITPVFEAWDIRNRPHANLGVYPLADQAKARCEVAGQ